MKHFTKDYLDFFKELAANNNKEWFNANKKRYEKSVKEPFHAFTDVMIEHMKKRDKRIDMTHKQAVFRIYKDVRFSKDKTPYKLQMSAAITPGGKKDMHGEPSLYMQMGPEDVRIYSGIYMPEKDTLMKVREYIAQDKNYKQYEKVIADPGFKKYYRGEVLGEQNKRLPTKELQAAAEKYPIILNKQFYIYAKLPASTITKDGLDETLMEVYDASKPVRDYLKKAMGK